MIRFKALIVLVLVVAFAAAVVSSTMGGGDASAVHTMPNGSTMSGDQMDR